MYNNKLAHNISIALRGICCISTVMSQLQGTPGSSSMAAVDCSNTGAGQLVLKPINLKNMKGEQMIKAKFDIPVSTPFT